MLISDLRERATQSLLDFAWRQWAQVGLSANLTGLDRWSIDPEALILFTIEVARRDPRLFDEMLDWLTRNRRLLTMQRLWNLTARFPVDPGLVGAVVALVWDPVSPSRWLKSQRKKDQPPEDGSVFAPDVLSFVGEPDPTFAEYGYMRPRAVLSGKSSEPDVRMPANLAFQLRHLFGPGSRSEVMRMLLTYTEGPLDAARVSDEAGFAKRNVSEALTDLVASGVVKTRWSGNERLFLASPSKWATFLEVGTSAQDMPEFVSWVHLLPVFLEIVAWLEHEAGADDSEYLISSRARDLVERITPDLDAAGSALSFSSPLPGAAYLPEFINTVESLLAKIDGEQAGGSRLRARGRPVITDSSLTTLGLLGPRLDTLIRSTQPGSQIIGPRRCAAVSTCYAS